MGSEAGRAAIPAMGKELWLLPTGQVGSGKDFQQLPGFWVRDQSPAPCRAGTGRRAAHLLWVLCTADGSPAFCSFLVYNGLSTLDYLRGGKQETSKAAALMKTLPFVKVRKSPCLMIFVCSGLGQGPGHLVDRTT